MRIIATGLGVLVADIAAKRAVQAFMTLNQSIPIIPGVFHLTYVLNPGAAFGLFAYRTNYFIVVAVAVIILILAFGRSLAGRSVLLQTSFGLQLGGAVGNLIDRVIAKKVVDFLDLRVWPVFNLADAAICIGVALFALDVFFGKKGGGAAESTRESR